MAENEHDYYRAYIEDRYASFCEWYNELFHATLVKPLDWRDTDFLETFNRFEQDYENHQMQQKIMSKEA